MTGSWPLLGAVAAASFAVRYLPLRILGDRSLPAVGERMLAAVAPAAMAALLVTAVFAPHGRLAPPDPALAASAAAALGVGLWRRSLPLSVVAAVAVRTLAALFGLA